MRVDYSKAEPLLPDSRIERIEALSRLAHPLLPDDAQFASARVTERHPIPCGCGKDDFLCPGGDIPYAHLLLIAPVPGIPDPFRMRWVKRFPLSLLDRFEREQGHYVGGRENPVQWSFDQMALDATRRLASAAEMDLPEEP